MECRALELLKLERVNGTRIAVREKGDLFLTGRGCVLRV